MSPRRKMKRISDKEIEALAAQVMHGELTFDEAAGAIPEGKKRNRKRSYKDALDDRLPGSFETGKRR